MCTRWTIDRPYHCAHACRTRYNNQRRVVRRSAARRNEWLWRARARVERQSGYASECNSSSLSYERAAKSARWYARASVYVHTRDERQHRRAQKVGGALASSGGAKEKNGILKKCETSVRVPSLLLHTRETRREFPPHARARNRANERTSALGDKTLMGAACLPVGGSNGETFSIRWLETRKKKDKKHAANFARLSICENDRPISFMTFSSLEVQWSYCVYGC